MRDALNPWPFLGTTIGAMCVTRCVEHTNATNLYIVLYCTSRELLAITKIENSPASLNIGIAQRERQPAC